MVSTDLEKSLRDAVIRHSDERLGGFKAELTRLRTQLDDALTALAERPGGDDNEAAAALAATVSEHLHMAHTEGVEEAASRSQRARASSDVALIKAAVDDIDNQRTQTDILNALVNRAASFAPRVAFFIIKNNRATGWRARGLEGTVGDEAVREISLPLETRTLLSEVAESKQTWSGAANAHDGNQEIFATLGAANAPERLVAVPLVARGRAVAALYADSADLDADAINLEALETMVRVAGMAVELLATQRPAPADVRTPPAPQPFVPPPPAVVLPSQHSSTQPFTQTPPAPAATGDFESSNEPEMAQSPPMNFDDAPSQVEMPPPPPPFSSTPIPPPDFAQPDEAASSGQSFSDLHPPEMPAADTTAAPDTETGIDTSEMRQSDVAEEAGATASPLGAARSYGRGGAGTELPVEVATDEERRFHNDARRFARLLVSEIKLYNEQKVLDGRAEGNIYTRLREEIDRSREMYNKRVRPEVAATYDYFHAELINTLAEGDTAKLGEGYTVASTS